MTIKISYAPEQLPAGKKSDMIFLAGSIEMGAAENWQEKVCERFSKTTGYGNLIVFNPRRKDWDSSWSDDDARMNQQIFWELIRIKLSDVVLFYFDPNTKSPVTMLELGMCLGLKKHLYVCCPDGFWKKKNVVETCNTFGVSVYNDLEDVLNVLRL